MQPRKINSLHLEFGAQGKGLPSWGQKMQVAKTIQVPPRRTTPITKSSGNINSLQQLLHRFHAEEERQQRELHLQKQRHLERELDYRHRLFTLNEHFANRQRRPPERQASTANLQQALKDIHREKHNRLRDIKLHMKDEQNSKQATEMQLLFRDEQKSSPAREMQLPMRDEQTVKLSEQEMRIKQLQRQSLCRDFFRNRQRQQQIVYDKLEALMERQTALATEEEEWRYSRAKAQRDAEEAKQRKDKEDKKAATIQAYSSHMQNRFEEVKMKKMQQHQKALEEYEATQEADRQFLEECKRKAQKAREEEERVFNFNVSMAAKKQARINPQSRCRYIRATQNADCCEGDGRNPELIQHRQHRAAEEGRIKREEVLRCDNTCAQPPFSKEDRDNSYDKRALQLSVDTTVIHPQSQGITFCFCPL